LIVSRVSDRSIGSFTLLRRIEILIAVPTLPRIFSTASCRVRPCTGSPSSAKIRSPDCTPAFEAGVSSIGDTTLMTPFSIVTSMPRPPNSPRVWTCMSL
jgi:hypothetical protein